MPRSNDPGHYPQAYQDYLYRVAVEGKTIRVPAIGSMPDDEAMPGMQRALKLRAHFYAFLGSLKRAAKVDPKWEEMANYANRTMLFLDKKNVALMFIPREQSWQQKLLETGGEVGASAVALVPDSAAAESEARVAAMLKLEDV